MFRTIRGPIAAGLIPLAVLNGCYAYLPASNPSPRPGAEVRARFTTPQSFGIGESTFFNIGTVEGEVAEGNGDTLVIWTMRLQSWGGGEKYWASGATLALPHDRLSQLEVRRFSGGRTALGLGIAGLGLALAVGLAAAIASGGPGSANGGGTEF